MDASPPGPHLLATDALTAGPLPAYRARIAEGTLIADPAQRMAAERLQTLWARLRDDVPAPANGLLARLRRLRTPEGADEARPHGLYLVGEVGRGKSMLMDLFFAAARVSRKRRVHFLAFMQDVHRRFHAFKRNYPESEDPIPPLAAELAAEARLLCFDEFQVNDIADAMILGRLFAALFEREVVVVATSNTAPDDLFKGQPGRDAFLPFIALIKQHLDVLVLDGGHDYRRVRLQGLRVWHVPADAAAAKALDAAFAELAGDAAPRETRLVVSGRSLRVPHAAAGVARFSFAALCEQPLGPGDYLALATHFHALVLDDVPVLGAERAAPARRFITLIDALYDHRVKLVASAAAAPDALYAEGEDAAMFARTASRLIEMQTPEWLALPHLT
ncbi:MAG: AFG1 family ATPase [Alphaproteobacteria bacterium]|nr:AFG1 family ATPase [Alphaproteobacteria bacterium]